MAKGRMLKMKLQPRPLRVQVVVATPEMVTPQCCATLIVTRDAATRLGLKAGEERALKRSLILDSIQLTRELTE